VHLLDQVEQTALHDVQALQVIYNLHLCYST
jgi:hypothetical protein